MKQVGIFGLLLIYLSFTSCTSEENKWKMTISNNKRAAYMDYLKSYPNGIHKKEGKVKIDSLGGF